MNNDIVSDEILNNLRKSDAFIYLPTYSEKFIERFGHRSLENVLDGHMQLRDLYKDLGYNIYLKKVENIGKREYYKTIIKHESEIF